MCLHSLLTYYLHVPSLVQVAGDTQQREDGSPAGMSRQRRASESDTAAPQAGAVTTATADAPKNNVDILQMLSKAQHEYDQVFNLLFWWRWRC